MHAQNLIAQTSAGDLIKGPAQMGPTADSNISA